MTTADAPDYVCPRCRGELQIQSDGYACAGCDAAYPVVLGIPDFRVSPDPWIGMEDDRSKARRVVDASEGMDLRESVATYWSMTPSTPDALARRFTDHVAGGERRAAEWLDAIKDSEPAPPPGPWLEIGCASGDLLAVAAERRIRVVGVDVAMRWLVLARRRPALQRVPQTLVCANGEALPFRERTFARVVSVGTLEHCQSAGSVLAESARVLRTGGDTLARTTNRFSLLPEPHVDVWGVGFVPRRWADAYVRWRSGQRYLHHHPLSRRELVHALRRAGFTRVRVQPARMLRSDRERLGSAGRAVVPMYDWMRNTPALRTGMAMIAPLLELRGVVR